MQDSTFRRDNRLFKSRENEQNNRCFRKGSEGSQELKILTRKYNYTKEKADTLVGCIKRSCLWHTWSNLSTLFSIARAHLQYSTSLGHHPSRNKTRHGGQGSQWQTWGSQEDAFPGVGGINDGRRRRWLYCTISSSASHGQRHKWEPRVSPNVLYEL